MSQIWGEVFWNIVRLYQVSDGEALIILNLEVSALELAKMKSDRLVPVDEERIIRISHLLAIHKNLRTLFPYNREVVYKWMTTARDSFGGMSAIQFICQDPMKSLDRLQGVRLFLDIAIQS